MKLYSRGITSDCWVVPVTKMFRPDKTKSFSARLVASLLEYFLTQVQLSNSCTPYIKRGWHPFGTSHLLVCLLPLLRLEAVCHAVAACL